MKLSWWKCPVNAKGSAYGAEQPLPHMVFPGCGSDVVITSPEGDTVLSAHASSWP